MPALRNLSPQTPSRPWSPFSRRWLGPPLSVAVGLVASGTVGGLRRALGLVGDVWHASR